MKFQCQRSSHLHCAIEFAIRESGATSLSGTLVDFVASTKKGRPMGLQPSEYSCKLMRREVRARRGYFLGGKT